MTHQRHRVCIATNIIKLPGAPPASAVVTDDNFADGQIEVERGDRMPCFVPRSCALGCEGIVSKRLGSPYRSGRNDSWIKIKNSAAPAAKRIDEEDWSK
jgi:ATP-dependent DNA ligase